MDDGRDKHITNNGKGVKKRGDGLGTGPVGRADGYAGRKNAAAGSSAGAGSTAGSGKGNSVKRAQGGSPFGIPMRLSGGNMALILILLVIAFVVYIKFFAGNSGNGGSPLSGLTGFGGGSSPAAAWNDDIKNTGKLDTGVASAAREKRTVIKGGGKDVITIMVYMCGTDLESKHGMATNDLNEMMDANIADNINIIVYTGGCKNWQTDKISESTNQIYKVTKGKMELLVSDDGAKPMTDPDTLSSFIKYCSSNYPANRYDLIFWDHGGGSITGYGYDEKFASNGSMSLTGINSALKKGGVTFDFIGFDACLMATLETAFMAGNYADYLIASEETEPGIGWYYTDWLNALSKDTSMSTLDIGKNIVDGFVDKCAEKCKGQMTTLSVIDLAELTETVPDKLAGFANDTTELIAGDEYKLVSDARAGSREFATSSKIDQIDLINFTDKIGTDEAKELRDALLGAVKYNRTSGNMTNAYGISIYFPYKKASYADKASNIYDAIGMDDDYSKCIKSFAGLEQSGQITASGTGSNSAANSLFGTSSSSGSAGADVISGLLSAYLSGGRSLGLDADVAAEYVAKNQFDARELKWTEEDGKHLMAIKDEQWALIQSLQMNMFYDDGEGYIDLGLDNTYKFEDGKLVGECDNTWVSIDGQPVAYYYETTTVDENGEKVTVGRVPALVNGERCNLIIIFDFDHPTGYIAGARYDYVNGETEASAKSSELKTGDTIDFICDYYNYNGDYMESYMLGDQLTYSEGLEISNTYVGNDTVITYLLTDMYGNEYWTPSIK